jgi:23S rRNA (pseudouridine1915-N3)-methyltransferase
MLKITLLVIGRIKSAWIAEGCSEFLERLSRQYNVSTIELPASRAKDAEKQREEESEQIVHHLEKCRGDVWLLDERGSAVTSVALAELVSKNLDRGTPLTFVIGGAYGVMDVVRRAVHRHLRLSDMTLTHEMSRLLLLEQLYRAAEIQRGSGYHH